jgi:hypothetical protein
MSLLQRGGLFSSNSPPLILMSLPFFLLLLTPLIPLVFSVVRAIIPLSPDPVSLIAPISLCGGILFLSSTREENPGWYLRLPPVVTYGIMVLAPIVAGIFRASCRTIPFPSPGVTR